jgi:alpha-tubulin suppressor-like RCC1 family protein
VHRAAIRPRPVVLAALLLLAACGDDPTGIQPRDLPRATVAAGTDHSCALDSSGEAWCWGSNRLGQLGAPDVELLSWLPVPVAGGREYVSIAAATPNSVFGPFVTCALTAGGDAYCWGRNTDDLIVESDETCSGIQGDTHYSFPCVRIPTRVAPQLRFAQITVGNGFICGVTGAGDAWCWGEGERGQLGNGTMSSSVEPTRVTGGHRFAMVSAADDFACGLDTAGAVWCWGDNTAGKLGSDVIGTSSAEPVRVTWVGTFRWVDVGTMNGCAVQTDGRAVCWGAFGGLGYVPTPDEPPNGPVFVQGGHEYHMLSTGLGATCGTTRTGGTLCWGNLSSAVSPSIPSLITASIPFGEVSVGYRHGCGRAGDDVWCWGDNLFPTPGKLGVGEQVTSSAVPLAVSLP